MKRIKRILDRNHVVLVCDHVALVPLAKVYPPFIACYSCLEGRPADRELLRALVAEAGVEELAELGLERRAA